MGNFDGRITGNTRLRGDYWLLEIGLEARLQAPQPGRFLMLKVSRGTDPLLRRPFAIHDFLTGPDGSTIRILYRVCGRGTSLMTDWREGETADIIGPLGRGFAVDELPPVIVAGGIGAAPMVYLARVMTGRGLGPEVFLGGNTADDLLGVPMFAGLGLAVREATMDGSRGRRGTVVDLLAGAKGGRGPLSVYACGPAPMLAALARTCRAEGWRLQASVEARMACGLGLCLGCAVRSAAGREGEKYLMACREGPVFGLEDLAW